jgi:adenosylmethionine-8-amino-7-oxononanoate aminotransferase
MGAGDPELVLTRGEGVWLWDEQGSRYLDANASLWYCNVGHGRAELARAAAGQMETLAAYHTYGVHSNRPMVELADLVAELAPFEEARTFFTSGGSDSIDTAAKIVRRYWAAMGQPERQTFAVREGAYHGMNAFGTSLAGIEVNRTGYGDLIPGIVKVPRADLGALEALFDERGHEVGALVAEPVIGAGGVYPPPDEGYWQAVAQLCAEHDVLIVMDEVVTGFGRLGRWFGCERYGLQPDVIVAAKGITSGYMPLGAVICSPRVQEPFFRRDSVTLRHGYTYSGHPTACAVALANAKILRDESLVERVATLEPVLASEVARLSAHPLVGEVRSAGLMAGVEVDGEARAAAPDLVERVATEARERGVLLRPLLGHTLQISPPFVITPEEIRHLVDVLHESFDAVQGQSRVAASTAESPAAPAP